MSSRPATNRECSNCSSQRIVPVLFKRIERSSKPGNKFRSYCMRCNSFGPCTSEDHFRESLHPYILPADGNPDNPDDLVPLEQYDYDDEWDDLVDDVVDRRDERARADGGSIDEPPETDDDPETRPPAEDHEFSCPICDVTVGGYPDQCPNCQTPYNWESSNETDETDCGYSSDQ